MKLSVKCTVIVAALIAPVLAYAYPNGTPFYVTDASPFCASCHSAARAEYMPEFPPAMAEKETPEKKHYGLVRSQTPPTPYMELTDGQKDAVIKEARTIDKNSSVTIAAPSKVRTSGIIKVTVKAAGGNGPVIGVMLVDRALRYQARAISSSGWMITHAPVVKGQDGAQQTGWLDKRVKGVGRNLNFILIDKQSYDPGNGIYPSGEVTYTLRAPVEPGEYHITAAFLYGTENASSAAFFQRPSGRILFSAEHKIEVVK